MYVEAYESLLDVFTTLVQRMQDESLNHIMGPCAVEIAQSYLQCHLSPPEGSRTAATAGTYSA